MRLIQRERLKGVTLGAENGARLRKRCCSTPSSPLSTVVAGWAVPAV